jgi:hypothetical protein
LIFAARISALARRLSWDFAGSGCSPRRASRSMGGIFAVLLPNISAWARRAAPAGGAVTNVVELLPEAQQAQALASKTEAAIRSDSALPVANEPSPEILAKAVPALTAMRTDELHAADAQLAQTRQYYGNLSCAALDPACSTERTEGEAAAKRLATNVAAKKLELQRNASEANSERKLNTLSDEFVFKAPKLSGASTPPSGMAAPGKSGPH